MYFYPWNRFHFTQFVLVWSSIGPLRDVDLLNKTTMLWLDIHCFFFIFVSLKSFVWNSWFQIQIYSFFESFYNLYLSFFIPAKQLLVIFFYWKCDCSLYAFHSHLFPTNSIPGARFPRNSIPGALRIMNMSTIFYRADNKKPNI